MTAKDERTSLRRTIRRLERVKRQFMANREYLNAYDQRATWLAEMRRGDLVVPIIIDARSFLATITENLQAAKDLLDKLGR